MVDLSKAMLNNQRVYIYIDLYVIVIIVGYTNHQISVRVGSCIRNGDVHRF